MSLRTVPLDQSQSIESLIRRYSKSLIRYAASILKNSEAAKEIVQDCFLKVIEHPPENFSENIKGWLYRECRNRAIDSWRKSRKVEPLDQELEDTLCFSDPDPLQSLETSQSVDTLKREIQKLSSRHQEILFLKYNDGLSYKEISAVLNISVTNVGFILYEAVRTLRAVHIERLTDEAQRPEAQVPLRKYGD